VGLVGAELFRAKDWRRAIKASGGWIVGWVFSIVIQIVIGLIMIALFWWQARGG
jgi:uncharacterized protein YqgC (DUF456 family)